MSEQAVRERLRTFILEVFYLVDAAQVTDDVSLIDSGIVDSTGVLDIILFIESEFGIDVGDEEAIPENLESIAKIASFIERKRSASAHRA